MNTSSQITPTAYPGLLHSGHAPPLAGLRTQRILRAWDQDRVQVRVLAPTAAPDEIAGGSLGTLGSKLVGRLRRRAEEQLLAHLQRAPVPADDLLAVRPRHLELVRSFRGVDRSVGFDPRRLRRRVIAGDGENRADPDEGDDGNGDRDVALHRNSS